MSNEKNPEDIKENQVQEQKVSDKELNFRKLEAERNAAIKMAEDERIARIAAEKLLQNKNQDDDDDDDEPYVDKRKLEKKLAKFGQKTLEETDTRIQTAVNRALSEERRQMWLKNNPDFYEVMNHAQKFAEKDPELAETILEMPDSFERQKLVYKNIKALGLHKKEEAKQSIQETIDKNRRSPYYQPSGVGTPPYASGFDYTPTGGKAAYDKMQELKSKMRL